MTYDTIEVGTITLRPDPSGRWAYVGGGLTLTIGLEDGGWVGFEIAHGDGEHAWFAGRSAADVLADMQSVCNNMAENARFIAALAGSPSLADVWDDAYQAGLDDGGRAVTPNPYRDPEQTP